MCRLKPLVSSLAGEGLGLSFRSTSGDGSLEITIKFWTFNFIPPRFSGSEEELLRPEESPFGIMGLGSRKSWSSSIKEVTAVMVLSASIDSDEEHLELISEAAIEADWAAAASRGSESEEVM